MPENPLSPYAATKLAGEKYGAIFYRLYGLPAVTLRYFNVFGPRQDPHSSYSAVISRFIEAALEGSRPVVHGDGEQSRDFTYVDNVAEANLLACFAEGVCGKAFNIGTGRRITLHELLRSLSSVVGTTIEPVYTSPRPGDVRHSQAGIEEARRCLRFEPSVTFQVGLERTVDWRRETMRQPAGKAV